METIQQILTMFAVDWQKFLSQVAIFTLVYTVLSKFAFKPVVAMLEQRRRMIEEAHENSEKVKQQLADADKRYEEILTKANAEAQRMIEEARESGSHIVDKKQQEAVAQAEQIIQKAREATAAEREKTMAELKREIGRLVVDTTAKVTGKVLTPEDQRRINEEAARQAAA